MVTPFDWCASDCEKKGCSIHGCTRDYKYIEKPKMEPQKITGYRNLSPAEVELTNNVKALGARIDSELRLIANHLATQRAAIDTENDEDVRRAELARLKAAEPERWLAMARTDFQMALMKAVRAITQPGNF